MTYSGHEYFSLTYKHHRFPPEIISHGVRRIFASAAAIAMSKKCCSPVAIIVTYEAIATSAANAANDMLISSLAGPTGRRTAVVTTRPGRAPHQTIADVGLIGGGQVSMPGEGSRAHHGVLFLDELPEFRGHILEVRRQPLEESLI
jgi:hypothetical protein